MPPRNTPIDLTMPFKKRTTKREPRKKVKAKTLTAPRGMEDILPAEWPWWDRVAEVMGKIVEAYDLRRIETPVLERVDLWKRGVGEGTDVVEKEMYTLRTKGGEVLALRPEGTSGIARAYLEHRLDKISSLQKLWQMSPMFRHDRPQAGRQRQFWQIGVEIMGGVSDPFYDAQTILIFERLLQDLGLVNVVLKMNSIGCRVCRPSYVRELEKHYKKHAKELCENCTHRLKTNPLRLLDCKEEGCVALREGAPNFLNKLCSACSAHFASVLEYLDELKIPYELDQSLVRGLDYYSRTVFEFSVAGPGEEVGALAGGGRYDYLFEMIGSKPMPAVGGAAGIERLIAAMKSQEVTLPKKKDKRVFLIHVGEASKLKMLGVIEELRKAGICVAESLSKESLSSQLKVAGREGVRLALIFGQKEIFEESVIIRDLSESTQETVPMKRMIEEVKKRLK